MDADTAVDSTATDSTATYDWERFFDNSGAGGNLAPKSGRRR
jgi:hypothetical protein